MMKKQEERMDEVKEEKKELTLEESFTLLDQLAEKLESRDISLEESLRLYKQGMELLKDCSEKIDTVEKKILQVNENGEFREF
ncbi:MAG TPA: exodeoxyribonuclease VII small subunit [Lachnospiraceae bacterium]|nr:exodeoxyribonuclease VII small subunit [Lachnospiraceae bacterium]